MPRKKRIPSKHLQYLGERIRSERNNSHLTQQMMADQTGVGLRHYQNIEKGFINPSYEVLSAIIHRLAMSADVLFYPDLSQQEVELRHLLSKFAACTEEERRFLLNTVDCMVEQFISCRQKGSAGEKPE